ncbi:ferredoxin--NADP+ reductase [Neorhodopirellula lusitana]|uniref:ferredoxin--NADP(+) reductase n=1 Tax=Neorhodopirellula lusitana TaxID=445327 RepID=A0ABY1PVY4_9BACT|nr:ferredoxin--NADP reductase [Neorhodopirellula lusitana]SMP46261.1 ferredoxin--NADP+ reductase [Neorhodopirellula lusitana]
MSLPQPEPDSTPKSAAKDSPRVPEPAGQTEAPPTLGTYELPDSAECQQLREKFYNATIIERIDTTEDLAKFRIRPDNPIPPFEPGQYVAIGLGNWEPRLKGTQPEDVPAKKIRKLVRRAYSISCPMLTNDGPTNGPNGNGLINNGPTEDSELVPVDQIDYLEFYITLVRQGATAVSKPPALTPRLFGKNAGDRLVLERKITGKYVLGHFDPDDTMLFLGTGTGEAPHNAMATKLLSLGHRGRIVVATSIRYLRDSAYQREHEILMNRFPNYLYLPLTTREPENVQTDHPGFVGKQYLQSMFTSGRLAELAKVDLSPTNTHVFLCGNPDMIGYVPVGTATPENPGMLPILRQAGFRDDVTEHQAGTIRFEKYW